MRLSYEIHLGDLREALPKLADKSVDVIITDPPYTKEVHARSIRRTYLPDVAAQPCRKTRKFEFGFDPLTPELMEFCAREFARIAKRWVIVFSAMEQVPDWRAAVERHGLDYVRQCVWVKERGMPQITGDRPGSWVESINVAHPKGRKRWNGGGRGNVFDCPVVVNCNGHRTDRVHPAQKPIDLMLELVELFTNPGEVVLDPFTGSGTTGVAAIQRGRRFIGIEQMPEHVATATERLEAAAAGQSVSAVRAKQVPLFGADK